jgi:hypothetical protein
LDPARGAVILPYDRFVPSENESSLIADAGSALVSKCAAVSGVVFATGPVLQDPVYDSEQFFGPWTSSQAEHFGFAPELTQADLVANGILPGGAASPPAEGATPSPSDGDRSQKGSGTNANLTDADWAVIDGCGRNKEYRDLMSALVFGAGPWAEPLAAVNDSVFDDRDAKAAQSDLSACLARGGMTADPAHPGLPVGADPGTISAAQVELALKTVACKDEVRFTQRVAAVLAAKQAPIVVAYLSELVAKRHALDDALDRARQILGTPQVASS